VSRTPIFAVRVQMYADEQFQPAPNIELLQKSDSVQAANRA